MWAEFYKAIKEAHKTPEQELLLDRLRAVKAALLEIRDAAATELNESSVRAIRGAIDEIDSAILEGGYQDEKTN